MINHALTVGIEARWFTEPAIKPGWLPEPKDSEPIQTMDTPEHIAMCHNCKTAECAFVTRQWGSCPILQENRRDRPLTQKQREFAERDAKVCVMVKDGWRDQAICQELGITKGMLDTAKRRLRERGELL